MGPIDLILKLISGYKTYASVIAMIVAGISAMLAKDYNSGLTQLFEALRIIFLGSAVASLRHAISKPATDPAK